MLNLVDLARWYGNYITNYFTNLPSVIDPNPIVGLNTMIYYAQFGYDLEYLIGKGGDLGVHAAARKAADANMLSSWICCLGYCLRKSCY